MLLVNATLIFFMIQKPGMPPHIKGQEGIRSIISKQLELNPEQETSYFNLAENHRMEMTEIKEKQRSLIKSYFDFLKNENENPENVAAVLEQLRSIEAEKLTATYHHFEDLKALCNPTQQAKFELIIDEIIGVLVGKENKLPPPPRDK